MESDGVERPGTSSGGMGLRVGKLGDIQWVQTVDIFLLTDAVQNSRLVNVFGER